MNRVKIEKEFNYKGFNGFILAADMGHRCGYVEIPEGHKFFGKDYDDIDIDCHGGLTYADDHIQEKKSGWVIGFDCAHLGDGRDFSIMSEKYKNFYSTLPSSFIDRDDIVWTTEMVEEEIKNIINQLI